ncbi:MAG: serine/threonine-protein kinase, partial [Polyangiales bacterium]
YVAHDINADQKVVIKSILPEFANRGDFRERTLAEGKALAKIDHQNVVRFNSIINSQETGELYIVMQFIEGESLDHTLEKLNEQHGKLPVNEVFRLFKQILDGVGAAHKEGLIHRDLKPANVLVRAKDGVAKVMDFGIAKAEGSTKGPTQAGGIVGSLFYMAPEQIKGARDLDKRLDVYALGVVLYELLTGEVPFNGETEYEIMTKHLMEPLPSLRLKRSDTPPWVDAVIAHATAKEREQRFQTCDEFRAAIDAQDGGIVVPRSMTALESPAVGGSNPSLGGVGRSGTAMMHASGGTTGGSLGGVPYVSGTSGEMSAVPKPSSGKGLLIGLVAALAIGGAAAAFVVLGGGDKGDKASAKGSDKSESKSSKHAGGGGGGGGSGGGKTQEAEKPAPKKQLITSVEQLEGNWKTTTTNRHLKAVKVDDDEIEFKVVDEKEWDNAFAKDEVRFKLTIEASKIAVDDRFRPKPGVGKKFSRDALASCLVQTQEVDGKRLVATLKPSGHLEVQLAAMDFSVKLEGAEVVGCNPPKITGTVTAELKKDD